MTGIEPGMMLLLWVETLLLSTTTTSNSRDLTKCPVLTRVDRISKVRSWVEGEESHGQDIIKCFLHSQLLHLVLFISQSIHLLLMEQSPLRLYKWSFQQRPTPDFIKDLPTHYCCCSCLVPIIFVTFNHYFHHQDVIICPTSHSNISLWSCY